MAIRKSGNRWLVYIRPGGSRSKRIRKLFDTKAEATRFAAYTKNQFTQGKPWNPDQQDKRRLSDLVDRWYKLHGQSLKDGIGRQRKLKHLVNAMGDPLAIDVTANSFTRYRATRLDGGVTANTVNHDLAYLKAVFNELDRVGEWIHGNPLARLRKIKIQETELTYLNKEQLLALLEELKPHPDAYIVTWICLATGARWGEAENLQSRQIRNGMIRLQSKAHRRKYYGCNRWKGRVADQKSYMVDQ